MSPQLRKQKIQLQTAINWLNVVDECDTNQEKDPVYYKEIRKLATTRYMELMVSIFKDTIEISQVKP
jgi:hypothetical protein